MSIPKPASRLQIHSYKHNGQLHRVWENNFVLKGTNTMIIGANDRTKVIESDGRSWLTREPAIFYFHSNYWFNIIGMLRDNGVHYYCNLGTPYIFEQGVLKYIDYDLDIKVYPDMTYQLLDEDEYEEHKKQMNYPSSIDKVLENNMNRLIDWIRQRKGPFSPTFVDEWYERYLTYR